MSPPASQQSKPLINQSMLNEIVIAVQCKAMAIAMKLFIFFIFLHCTNCWLLVNDLTEGRGERGRLVLGG